MAAENARDELIEPGVVLDVLGGVLDSRAFARSPSSRTFLAFVVSETLAGRGGRLSERTIARLLLRRPDDGGGSPTSAARVRATRVREALTRYYEQEGATDAVRISLPPGSYVPRFARVEVTGPAPASMPGVLVLTPAHDETDREAASRAASLADALVARLSEYEGLRVVGPADAVGDVPALASSAGVSHVLSGRVTARSGRVRLTARLAPSGGSDVLWSHTVDAQADVLSAFEAEDRFAREAAARIGDACGAIHRYVVSQPLAAAADHASRARHAYYRYLDSTTKESIAAAVDALDAALEAGPRTADLLAMRGSLANARVFQGASADPAADAAVAESLAREALVTDPRCTQAFLVLGSAALCTHRWELAAQCARAAVEQAPWRPSKLLSGGLIVEASGHWDEGMALVEEAFRLNPGLPAYMRVWLAIGHVMQGRYAQALAQAAVVEIDGEVFGPLYRCLALAGLGDAVGAGAELARVKALVPDVLTDPTRAFTIPMNVSSEQQDRIRSLLAFAATDLG